MINAIEWFKAKGFTFDDKITIQEVIALQTDAQQSLREQFERELKSAKADAEGLRRDYNELLYAVARKFPNETRHQTALRYINECERQESQANQASGAGKES